MHFLRIFYFTLSFLFLIPINISKAQQGPFPYINVGGVPMHCVSARNQRVMIFIDPRVNQYIGIAQNNGYPTIRLGPGFFSNVPPLVGQFWFLHECAHHVVGGNEAAADCYAIRNLRNIGAIRHPEQVRQLLFQISSMPGSFTHLPGKARAQNIFTCLNS
ncbi:hypothetical protein ACQU0X_02905 [Pseudovibrio ascidiaceicola]|uniref:hypothetical protein n=1 Tax=Pseudovibrio ascidiaceicola TaxID=285279 RepID=UPI003D35D49E